MPRVDSEIDHLYQVPLAEFTAERNALAKRAGSQGAEIRALQKPSVPAWAVNQLYWKQRRIYDALIERAEDLRATHNATLRGKRTDLRGASRAHEEALETALKATLALLAESGHPATDATRQAVATTLRALPGDEAPGRLARQLQPRGFEMLAGAGAQGRVRPAPRESKPEREAPESTSKPEQKKAAALVAAARQAAAAAARATRDAEHVVRREEFEAARAAREAEKAVRQVTEAEEALQEAEAALAEARRAATAAEKARDAAQTRAARAEQQLNAAREEEEAAKKKLDALT